MTDEASVPEWTCERAVASDGIVLGLRRYARPECAPVLLLHGLAQNLNGWDLPVEGHSLARYLSARGFDVWLGNFRGHGRMPHRSGDGARPARVDDFGVLDVPAMIERVRRVTRRRPLIVAHSMGGAATLIHLQGARYDAHGRVVGEPLLAARRNDEIAGAVLAAVPATLRWPVRAGVVSRLRGAYFETNGLLELCGLPVVRRVLDAAPMRAVPTGGIAGVARRGSGLPGPLGRINATVATAAGFSATAALAHTLWHPGNMRRDLIDAELLHTMEDASVAVLRQFCDWIAHGSAREFTTGDAARPAYEYADHYDRITAPLLLLAGDSDRVVPPVTLREDGLARFASADRGMLVLRGFGHNDLRVGTRAPTHVFPRVAEWLADRAGERAGRLTAGVAGARDRLG
jgi:alpha-beta hydrolase superfamily lysophospholipase